MLFKQFTFLIIAANFAGLALAKKGGSPPCGAPFCDRKGIATAIPSLAVSTAATVAAAPVVTAVTLRV